MSTRESAPPSESSWDSDVEEVGAPTTRRSSVGIPGAGMQSHGPRVLPDGTGTAFRVYAPARHEIELVLFEVVDGKPREKRRVKTAKGRDGHHVVTVRGVGHGALYQFLVDGKGPFPDPASRRQPFGVHGPSEVVRLDALSFTCHSWRGRPIEELVIYEVHVGTATREGTFRALEGKLDHLASLGVTALELMPIADFPGDRNWGYDGVALFAPARCYGTPEDLAALVDAAHARGLSVILDVVYNHLGPDGNYLRVYADEYFTKRHLTPWGDALNCDTEGSDAWRTFVLENAEQWIRDYRFDGLRLDATHQIYDSSSRHLLSAICDVARASASEREVVIIAEDERNDAKLVREASRGGVGLDAVWADDFHHEIRRIVAGDDEGYFRDYRGTLFELLKILHKGWLYEGQTSAVTGKPRGTPAFDIPPPRFVHCIQNHDQVGNRARGERLGHSVPRPQLRAATTLLLSTPYTPLLFMGQELGATSPFLYFTDHEPELGKKVTEGRRNEFKDFRDFTSEFGRAQIPDPQDPMNFERSKIDWREAEKSPGKELIAFHRALLAIRRDEPAMRSWRRGDLDVLSFESLVCVRRRAPNPEDAPLLFVIGLTDGGTLRLGDIDATSSRRGCAWSFVLDSESKAYGGSGNAVLEGRKLTLTGPGAVVLKG